MHSNDEQLLVEQWNKKAILGPFVVGYWFEKKD